MPDTASLRGCRILVYIRMFLGGLTVAMPVSADQLAKLKRATGATVLPPDFDEFWDLRMAEADEVALRYEIVPAEEVPQFEQCHFYDLWFYGMGGARLYAKYIMPQVASVADVAGKQAHANAVPLVLQFHGYPGASRSWFEQASFAALGYAVLALDNPGQGGKSQDIGGYAGTTVSGHLIAGLDGDMKDSYYTRLYQDIRILCRIARELEGIDSTRVFVNGASQGGGIGVACSALNADLISRAAILYPFLSDYRGVFELGKDEGAYEGLRYYSRWFDPDGTHQEEKFKQLAYVDTLSFAHLVRCEVLFGSGLSDEVCPLPTQFAVYNALAGPKLHLTYPSFAHEEIQAFDDLICDFYEHGLEGMRS